MEPSEFDHTLMCSITDIILAYAVLRSGFASSKIPGCTRKILLFFSYVGTSIAAIFGAYIHLIYTEKNINL